ncbi:hypothetical protein LguiB_006509 [Lonicera macranthoides]
MANDKKLVKCGLLGRGSYGTVYLAAPLSSLCNYYTTSTASSQLVAVKSTSLDHNRYFHSLQLEGRILYELRGCPEIITCFGDDVSTENGTDFYNLLLELAPEGTLANLIDAQGGRLPEWEVHCDFKPSNILVFPSPKTGINYLKIADFGLAKKRGNDKSAVATGSCFRGVPLYSSPESVIFGEHEAPMDVWALGCTIFEMVTGKPMWSGRYRNRDDLLYQIQCKEVPDMPEEMSEQGKDFLRRCLAKHPANRQTAEMLLSHPFITIGNFADVDEGRNMLAYQSLVGFGWVSSLSLFSVHC